VRSRAATRRIVAANFSGLPPISAATTLGVLFGLAPLLGVFACLTWSVVAVAFRYASLATLAAVVAVPFYAWFMGQTQLAVVTAVLAVLLALRHHENIRRLLTGQEPNIGANAA